MRLVLTRHGETDWNVEGRMQGHSQTPINDRGRYEAHTVGEALKKIGVTKIYSSDLLRAVQTTEIISTHLGLPFEKDVRLREFCFGSMEGLVATDILARDGEMKHAYEMDNYISFGGENSELVHARMHKLLRELEEKYFSETVLLVGHGLFMYTLQKKFDLLLLDEDEPRGIKRGEFQVVDFQNSKAQQIDFWKMEDGAK